MVKAVYPGSFDPLTYGHLDIINRSKHLFAEINVAVVENPDKDCLFTSGKRVEIIENAVKDIPRVTVEAFSGLTVNYVKNIGADTIIRGLRSVSDFEGELQMANMNRTMCSEVETVFLMTSPKYAHVSSSLIKEIAEFKGEYYQFVPESSARALKKKFSS